MRNNLKINQINQADIRRVSSIDKMQFYRQQ